ncbi:MAG: alanine dehydrogenase, partial [Spirochaetota bacterium]|nr:alanine dehydrogenase [Spirochaetota bacterium]
DQGGCTEFSRPTTHIEPTFRVEDVILYCVANIPSIVSRTASIALSHSTFPYIKTIAGLGIHQAARMNQAIRQGISVHKGEIVNQNLAETFNRKHKNFSDES